jgi:multimeric flavodoxin WrbA
MALPKIDIASVPVKILFINTSPLEKDHTYRLVEESIKGARSLENVEIDTFEFHGKEIKHCQGCVEYCFKKLACVHRDDLMALGRKWLACDGMVWASPVFTFGVPASVRGFIDRFGELNFQARWTHRLPWWRYNKPTGTIVTGSANSSFVEMEGLGLIEHFVVINNIPLSGDTPECDVAVVGKFKEGESADDQPDLLRQAFALGKRVTEMSKFLTVGKMALASSLPDHYWPSKENYIDTVRPKG